MTKSNKIAKNTLVFQAIPSLLILIMGLIIRPQDFLPLGLVILALPLGFAFYQTLKEQLSNNSLLKIYTKSIIWSVVMSISIAGIIEAVFYLSESSGGTGQVPAFAIWPIISLYYLAIITALVLIQTAIIIIYKKRFN
jgi:hypothetical protein